MQIIYVLLILVFLQSCSNEVIYDSIKSNQRSKCEKLHNHSQYESCMREVNPEFDEYERERERLLKDKKRQ